MNAPVRGPLRPVYLAIGPALAAALAAAPVAPTAVRADVTIEQKTSLEVASLIRVHGAMTTSIGLDKKREDTESHCEGVMSLVCGNLRSGEIVRLDRGVTWHLQPEKKTYRETVFATPGQIAEMRARMQANLEKMRSCPVSQKQQPIDRSKCQMSPPKIEVRKMNDRLTIAGHDAERTSATLTESCTDRDTGDVCDTVIAVDVWLTQDRLPGADDRRAFGQAYARKLGLEDAQGALRGDFAKYLAPYAAQIKELTDKSAEFKGQPLRTSLRVVMGGPQCKAAANAGDSSGGSADSANPMANVAQAGKAIGSAFGGLFHKKKTEDSQAPAANTPNTPSPAPAGPDPYAQYTQLATFSIETLKISDDAIPAERFEVPADWRKDVPPPAKKGDDEFSCPKIGRGADSQAWVR